MNIKIYELISSSIMRVYCTFITRGYCTFKFKTLLPRTRGTYIVWVAQYLSYQKGWIKYHLKQLKTWDEYE
jgi:hypothetical protein